MGVEQMNVEYLLSYSDDLEYPSAVDSDDYPNTPEY